MTVITTLLLIVFGLHPSKGYSNPSKGYSNPSKGYSNPSKKKKCKTHPTQTV
jgi:hypothetical protein